jgi:hemerythrin-like domain-containing protein
MGAVIQILRHEQETIQYVLKILNKMIQAKSVDSSTTQNHITDVVRFLDVFAEQSHHRKEDALIDALSSGGAFQESELFDEIRQDHTKSASLLLQMNDALVQNDTKALSDLTASYLALMESSIIKENQSLFRLADQTLDEDRQDDLLEYFLELENTVIGRDLSGNMHNLISTWADAADL